MLNNDVLAAINRLSLQLDQLENVLIKELQEVKTRQAYAKKRQYKLLKKDKKPLQWLNP